MRNSTWIRNVIRTMIWIWILIKTDVRFCTTCMRVSARAITDTSISSRVSLLQLFYPFITVIINCSRQNESVKSGTIDVRLDFECKEDMLQIQQLIVSSYTIAWFIIHWSTLYAKLPKCISDTDKSIKFIKSTVRRIQLLSTAVFSTTCSCQCSWIYKDSSLTRNLLWRK